jgi:hypothetical protein
MSRSDKGKTHNVSAEGRKKMSETASRDGRRKGKKLLQDKKGLFAPGFLQSPKMQETRIRNDEKLRQEERGIYAPGFHQSSEFKEKTREHNERMAQEQKGIFAPDFYDRPEIKKAHRQNGIIQGNAAVERGDGIHAPGMASLGGKTAYRLGLGLHNTDNPDVVEGHRRGGQNQKLLHILYGAHIQHHVNKDHRHGKPCVFCDRPKSLPKWFFAKLKQPFQGGAL